MKAVNDLWLARGDYWRLDASARLSLLDALVHACSTVEKVAEAAARFRGSTERRADYEGPPPFLGAAARPPPPKKKSRSGKRKKKSDDDGGYCGGSVRPRFLIDEEAAGGGGGGGGRARGSSGHPLPMAVISKVIEEDVKLRVRQDNPKGGRSRERFDGYMRAGRVCSIHTPRGGSDARSAGVLDSVRRDTAGRTPAVAEYPGPGPRRRRDSSGRSSTAA